MSEATDRDPQKRIEVHGSLFRALLDRRPDLVPTPVSKGALVVVSHLIEAQVADAEPPTALLSGFQHAGKWAAERDRYLRLAESSDVIAVFAGEEPPPGWQTDHVAVRLDATNPLEQEWFVLAIGPSLAITLCGLDGDAHARRPVEGPTEDADRMFDVVWSFDPAVARAAADVVVASIAQDAPERADDVRARVRRALPDPTAEQVAAYADRTTAGMLARLEHLRRRERSADRRSSAAKTAFLSRMSHELRTPLNAILGFAQLLEGADMTAEDADGVAQISRAGHHLLTLVNDLLDISQIESGMLPVTAERMRVADAVADAVDLARPGAQERDITVESDDALGSDLHAFADRRHVVQILLNLLSNAIKYDRPGGTVTLRVRSTVDEICVDVQDTGPGIAYADLGDIFAPFSRLPGTKAGTEGTGLGLSLSRAMAAATNGRIDVVSTPGEGSTFTLVLPTLAPGTPSA
jgi:signal transduction histidine kinase